MGELYNSFNYFSKILPILTYELNLQDEQIIKSCLIVYLDAFFHKIKAGVSKDNRFECKLNLTLLGNLEFFNKKPEIFNLT